MIDLLKKIIWKYKMRKSPYLQMKYGDGDKPEQWKTREDKVYDRIYPDGRPSIKTEKKIYKTAYEKALQDLSKQYTKEYEARKKREEMEEQRLAEKQRKPDEDRDNS